ncbi:MAG: hypothetical protein DMD36_13390 [Gemmatimonadetes bacterium]|nr:MAG: hypothetical protein DMD36_13390 [Gemmatimonadota bacterium]
MGAALRRPLADVVVLRRERGRSGVSVDVFVSLSERSPAVIEALGGRVMTRAGSLFGARVPLSALRALGADSRVRYVQAARRVKPNNDLAMQDIRASLVRTQTNGIFTGATGSNVIVGTFDTGIDWSHPDFKHPDGTTRILYIWDLTTTGAPPGNVGGQVFDRGNECSAALITAGACSEHDIAGHGSHVAGIAAGDGSAGSPYQYAGVAPNADIIAVKGGDVSFSFADVLAGIEYIFKRADVLGRPAVVNLSLGSDFGAHDGTESEEQAIDSLVGPGHIVVIAAGNSGSNPTAITGNSPPSYLHATRTLITGDTAQLGVTVPAYSAAAGSINDYMWFSLWYDRRDSITVTVRRPDGTTLSRSTAETAAEDEGPEGHIYIDNASGGPESQNGDRLADIEMYDQNPAHPPAAGTWVITIRLNRLGGSGRFDVWEDAATSTLAGSQISGGGDNAYIVNTPGNAARAITVAAHVNRVNWTAQAGNFQYIVREQVGDLATFSSSGPTRPVRDSLPSRQKPDLSAPGKGVFSVYSSTTSPPAPGALIAPDGVHVLFSGTSMSTPMVTGSVALLLERKPDLTPEQVRTILTGSARQDGFSGVSYAGFGGGVPNPSWGYGKLDVQAALALVPLNLTATKGPRDDSLGGRFVVPRANIPSRGRLRQRHSRDRDHAAVHGLGKRAGRRDRGAPLCGRGLERRGRAGRRPARQRPSDPGRRRGGPGKPALHRRPPHDGIPARHLRPERHAQAGRHLPPVVARVQRCHRAAGERRRGGEPVRRSRDGERRGRPIDRERGGRLRWQPRVADRRARRAERGPAPCGRDGREPRDRVGATPGRPVRRDGEPGRDPRERAPRARRERQRAGGRRRPRGERARADRHRVRVRRGFGGARRPPAAARHHAPLALGRRHKGRRGREHDRELHARLAARTRPGHRQHRRRHRPAALQRRRDSGLDYAGAGRPGRGLGRGAARSIRNPRTPPFRGEGRAGPDRFDALPGDGIAPPAEPGQLRSLSGRGLERRPRPQ